MAIRYVVLPTLCGDERIEVSRIYIAGVTELANYLLSLRFFI